MMTRWGELKCPNCEELEAKGLANRVAIMRLEAKLAKAVEALEDLVKDCEADYPPSHGAMKYYAQRTLADLTGGKDE